MKRIVGLKHWTKLSAKKFKNLKYKTKTIAVMAASNKLGVTHLSLCMANFCASVLKEKVLYIELAELSQLLGLVGDKQTSYKGHIVFDYLGVTYALSCDTKEALELIKDYKGYVIVDIPRVNDDTQLIIKQCDKSIALGSMKPWCKRDIVEFFHGLEKGGLDMKTIRFVNVSENEIEKIKFKKEFGYTMTHRPNIDDPFRLSEEDFESLIELIK